MESVNNSKPSTNDTQQDPLNTLRPITNLSEAKSPQNDDILTASFTRKNSRSVKRIGIIGYGHLGQFLRAELSKYPSFYAIRKIWNRSEESMEEVLPLTDLDSPTNKIKVGEDSERKNQCEDALADVELVIEVAHPDVIRRYAHRILEQCDLFIGSVAALSDAATLEAVEEALRRNRHRRVFVPSAASFWGTEDIRTMARMGTLKSLTITIMKHPSALRVLDPLKDLSNRALKTNLPVVLYDGSARLLCASAPSIANLIASAALAARNLGFDGTRVKLIADPAILNWGIVEYEAIGENDLRTTCRHESPAQSGVLSNEDNTYFSILSSIREAFYRPPGFNIC